MEEDCMFDEAVRDSEVIDSNYLDMEEEMIGKIRMELISQFLTCKAIISKVLTNFSVFM